MFKIFYLLLVSFFISISVFSQSGNNARNGDTSYPKLIPKVDSVKALNEVVVVNTGYQVLPKERATGSFTSISKELFNQQSGPSMLVRLEAITNGLYFDRQTGNSQAKIVIRGLSTIQGPRAPLVILDDFPYEGDLNLINPNDVENITILKDAAAASIWGTRAGNGVIVITTKKGRFNQPVKVEFSSNMLVTEKPDLYYIKEMSVNDFIGVERFLYGKGFYNGTLSQPYIGVSPVVELLHQAALGNTTQQQADAAITTIGTHSLRSDLNRYIYQKGFNLQQAVTVRGGSKNLAWNISGGADQNADVLDNKYKRYNFRSSQTFRLTKALELATGIDYTQSRTEAGRPGYGQVRPRTGNLPVYTQLAAADGSALPVLNYYRQSYTDTVAARKLFDWNYYPLTDYQHVNNTNTLQAILGNVGLNYKLTKSLSLSTKYQYGKQTGNGGILYGAGSYYARDLINSYTQLNRTTGQLNYIIPPAGILDNSLSTIQTHNVRGQVNFSQAWKRHSLDAIAGSEYRQVASDYSAFRTYGYDPDNLTTGAVDWRTAYPNIITGENILVPDTRGLNSRLNRFISFYGNAAYNYNKKYTFSASARRDASNLFGASANNRWTPLWSIGAGWDISNESFYKFNKIPSLKLRASYGSSGNADPTKSAVTTLLYSGTSPYTNMPVARVSQFKNDELTWEKVKMFNLGLDFSLVGNRVQGSVEYYHKKATNLFGTSPVDYTTIGINTITKNVATIAGYGWDINLNSRNLTGPLQWSSQLNLNFNRDKVLQYYLANNAGSNFTLGGAVSAIEGRPVYALYAYKWAGLDSTGFPQGMYQGTMSKNYTNLVGPNTLITDMQYIGPSLPTATASVGNTIAWKAISLTVRITGKFGNWFQRTSIDYTDLLNNRVGHPDYELRWQKKGDELSTIVPSFIYPNNRNRNTFYRFSEVLSTRADFIRLQYITLSYDLKKPAIQFYINLNDLGLLWRANQYGIDPEYRNGPPPSMNMAMGLRATF